MKKKLYGYSSSDIELSLYRLPNGKKRNYCVEVNNRIIAYFDTEEKARMYVAGFEKGSDIGYAHGYRYANKRNIKKAEGINP